MQGHEIWMPAERPDRNVVPHPGVVFEAILQPFGETQLAARIEAGGARGWGLGWTWGLVVMWGRGKRCGVDFLSNITANFKKISTPSPLFSDPVAMLRTVI